MSELTVVVYKDNGVDVIVGVFDNDKDIKAAISKDINDQDTDELNYDIQTWRINELDGQV